MFVKFELFEICYCISEAKTGHVTPRQEDQPRGLRVSSHPGLVNQQTVQQHKTANLRKSLFHLRRENHLFVPAVIVFFTKSNCLEFN